MSAVILNHPRHEVILQDPREQAVNPPLDDALSRLEAFNRAYDLVTTYGYARVERWVRTAAGIAGQTDRPADRCLADGSALINDVCVQCGRDNS